MAAPSPASSSALHDHIARNLQELSKRIATVLCVTKEFDDPVLHYLSDDFRSFNEQGTVKINRTEFLEAHRRAAAALRSLPQAIQVGSTEVDELRGKATIWVQCRIALTQSGLQRECVWQLSWERRKNRWLCTRRTGLSGVSEYM